MEFGCLNQLCRIFHVRAEDPYVGRQKLQQANRHFRVGASTRPRQEGMWMARIDEVPCKQLMPLLVQQSDAARRVSRRSQHTQTSSAEMKDRVRRPPFID